jgi:HK97 family phage major capsid protein
LNINEMTLEQITARLAELDEQVRSATDIEAVNQAAAEKSELLTRKGELEDLQQRKQIALDITAGIAVPNIIATRKKTKMENMTQDDVLASKEYRTYWLKGLQNALTDVEKRANENWAAATALGAIPTITSGLFLEKMKQTAPLLNEINLFRVPGNFTIAVEGTRAAAAIHTENALITAADDTTTAVTLGGYEIAKLARVSKIVQKMGVAEFEQFLVNTLGGDIGRLIESYLVTGNGTTQPEGIEQAYATWTNDTNGVQWASSNTPTAAELMELIGYLEGSYAPGAKFLMNHKTFWTKIMTLRDDSKYPVVNIDGQQKLLMGFPVIFSSYVPDYTMYFGDFKKAVYGNFSEDINVAVSEHAGFNYNSVAYRASCIFDSKVGLAEALVKGATSIA